MLRQPLFWGVVVFSVACLGWVVAIIVSVLTAGALRDMANICGYVAIGSLPVAGFLELIRWARRGEMVEETKEPVVTSTEL